MFHLWTLHTAEVHPIIVQNLRQHTRVQKHQLKNSSQTHKSWKVTWLDFRWVFERFASEEISTVFCELCFQLSSFFLMVSSLFWRNWWQKNSRLLFLKRPNKRKRKMTPMVGTFFLLFSAHKEMGMKRKWWYLSFVVEINFEKDAVLLNDAWITS